MKTTRWAIGLAILIALGRAPAPAQGIGDLCPALDLAAVVRLEGLNRSVRFDGVEAMAAEWGASYGSIEAIDLPKVDNRYAIFRDDAGKRIDVAIRGTVNLKNAIFDLEFLKEKSPELGIHVHSGFETVALALYDDLKPRLVQGYRLRLAGHSLGAAEAIIVGMLLSRDGIPVEAILASAPPKVTDAEGWAQYAGLPVLRMTGPFDPVPFLPPRSLLYGRSPYIQGGKVLYLLDGRSYTILEGSFYDDLPDAMKEVYALGEHFGVKPHLLPSYLGRLLPKADGMDYVDPKDWELHVTAGRAARHSKK